jgi:hypothetical protein
MSKYKTKQQLQGEIITEKTKLDLLLSKMDANQKCSVKVCEEWTTKDIICHLAKWQEMVLTWYQAGVEGRTPAVPHEKYKWSQLPELNQEIYLACKDFSLSKSEDYFAGTESRIMKLLNSQPEETLLKPGLYPWMKKNNLIAYIGSCTASHYKWASDLIKRGCQSVKGFEK